jgi:hypothetical protein
VRWKSRSWVYLPDAQDDGVVSGGLLIRNTVPRVRIDQMMGLNWKFLVPISIVNLLVVSFLLKVMQELGWAADLNPVTNPDLTFGETLPMTAVLLAANLAMTAGIMSWLRATGRRERLAAEAATGEAVHASAGH